MPLFIAILFVAFCNFALGVIVLLKNRRSATNYTFFIFAVLLAIWLIVDFLSNDLTLGHISLLWLNRVDIFIPPLGLYSLLLFSLLFTNTSPKRFRVIAWSSGLLTLLMALIGVSGGVLAGLAPIDNIETVKFGKLTPVFMIYIVGMILLEIGVLLFSLRRLKGLARARTMYMAVSLFVAFTIIAVTNLFIPFFFNNFSYTVLGLFSTLLIVGGFSYAIIKLRLFDMRLVIARSIAYVLLTFTLGSVYAIITFRIGGIFFKNSSIGLQQESFGIATAIILAFTFQPLRRFFERATDHIFYRNNYDPQELINSIGRILASEIELIPLSRRIRLALTKSLHVEYVNIVALNDNKLLTESGHYVVSQLEALAVDLQKIRSPILVTDELPEGEKKEILNRYSISVFAALKTREGRVGYILFGHKLSGDIFTTTDLEVIRMVADQLAVGIQNAKSYVQIQQFNYTLRGKIHDATKRLREANNSLQQLDVAKDEFITMASHQLRTPLTVSESYLASFLDGMFGKFSTEQGRALRIAQEHLHVTNGIIADLLNINRMEVGRFHIDRTQVDFGALVQAELDHAQIKAKESNVTVKYIKPKRAVPEISLDKQKTQQAIMNIIDNAISYSPNGRVLVTLKSAGNHLIFRVTDNGIGVPEIEQPQLFSKFFRAKNAKSQRPDGTGIGLYLVKRVIEDQGGTLIFSSHQGEGSTFGFRLPINTTRANNVPIDNEKPVRDHSRKQ